MDDGIVDRDLGMTKVRQSNKEWMRRAILLCSEWRLQALAQDQESDFLPESLRTLIAAHIGEPSHSNAWGALTRILAEKNLIRPNGKFRHMQSRASHARLTRAYSWTPL